MVAITDATPHLLPRRCYTDQVNIKTLKAFTIYAQFGYQMEADLDSFDLEAFGEESPNEWLSWIETYKEGDLNYHPDKVNNFFMREIQKNFRGYYYTIPKNIC